MIPFVCASIARDGREALGYTVNFSELKKSTRKTINSGSRGDSGPKLIVYWAHVTHSNVFITVVV